MKLAILLYGTESEKPELTAITAKLQDQLNTIDKDDVEVVYYVNDATSVEEMKEWLLSQTEAKKYIFVTAATPIEDNFIILRYNMCKGGKKTEQLVEFGIYAK